MSLVESSLWKSGTIDHRFIVSKSIANGVDGNSQISEGVPQVNYLLNAGPSGDELRSIGSCLWCGLFLRIPHDQGLVGEMYTTGY